MLGALNTINQTLALAWYALSGATRTGTAAALSSLGAQLHLTSIVPLFFATLIAGSVGLLIARAAIALIALVNQRILSSIVLVSLVLGTLLFLGPRELFFLISAAALGIIAIRLGGRKSTLMACITIPYLLHSL